MYGLIPAPPDPSQWPAWREQLLQWRASTRKLLDYDDSYYRRPEFSWVSSAYVTCFLIVLDEQLYDRSTGQYTLGAMLDRGVAEFGGFDDVVFWQAYPRIGLDERNQLDFYRDMPGGLDGLRELSRLCHARGVRVTIGYNPWDTGTRREALSDVDVLVELVTAIDADGIFLDVLGKGGKELRAKLDRARPGVALQPEYLVPLQAIPTHHVSFMEKKERALVPGVVRNKWFERRHMVRRADRWSEEQTDILHGAWMNGCGLVIEEAVHGTWVGCNPRHGSILRAMLPIMRRYTAILSGEGWTPLVPCLASRVYASLWEDDRLRLWTIVNRAEEPVQGALLETPHVPGARYFDLIAGREVTPEIRDGKAQLASAIGPRGIACFLSCSERDVGSDFPAFLTTQAESDDRADFSTAPPKLAQTLTPIAPTRRQREVPAGMVAIPAAEFELEVHHRIRECGFYEAEGVIQPRSYWDLHGPAVAKRRVKLSPYAIDVTPVTNAQYAEFLASSGYTPKHLENFLKHWRHGAPPPGKEDHPVVYVDLEDARAYAQWADKRLPTEEEWQHAAQGPEKRTYPWGDEMREGVCNSGLSGGTSSVTAFPEGRSAFGCYDMCGNVWELTESERSDGRIRFCILKGGSYFRALGSEWYFDGGPRPANWGAKMLLMWPGMDRCSTIGFRCVVDMAYE